MNLNSALRVSLKDALDAPAAQTSLSINIQASTGKVGVILDAIESIEEITSMGPVKISYKRQRNFDMTTFSIEMEAPAIIIHQFILILKFLLT